MFLFALSCLCFSLPFPFPIQHKSALLHLHSPGLGFSHHRLPVFIQQVIYCLPANFGPFGCDNPCSNAAPVSFSGVMKIIAAIQAGKSPVQAGLVLMMPRTIFGQFSLAIRSNNGVYIRTNVLRSEEHTSELQSLLRISYAVFCLTNK